MKKILLTLFVAGCFLPAYSQTYYQKVPKLVPTGDGTYRILEGEYEYVPVNEQGYAPAVIVEQEYTNQQNAALAAEAARWARGESATTPKPVSAPAQQPQTVSAPKEKTVPQNKTSLATTGRPYVSIGAAGMNSSLSLSDESAFYTYMENSLSSMQPGIKATYGAYSSDWTRTEIFFQWRGELSKSGQFRAPLSQFSYTAKVQMWDVGANAFLYANPYSKMRFFLGGSLAVTRVRPKFSINGIDINDLEVRSDSGESVPYRFELFKSKLAFTPSIFVGMDFPLDDKTTMDIIAFYSQTNIDTDGIDRIETFGVAANVRFNFLK